MAIGVYINIFLQVLWQHVMPIVGVVATLGALLFTQAHRFPVASVRDRLGTKLVGKGSRIIGRTLIALKDEDGLWSLKPATYDKANNGYWVPTDDGGREFYNAEGVGGDPGTWYGGATLAVAYDGLGALADPASAEVGRQARVKREVYESDLSKRGQIAQGVKKKGGELIASAKGQLLGDDVEEEEEDILADGGDETVIDQWDTLLPDRKVVDLRDTIHAAPFNVRPQQFHRVAENAKEGQRGFAKLGPIGQATLLMGAFMLGAIVCYLGFSASGGGGGGGISLPMMAHLVGV